MEENKINWSNCVSIDYGLYKNYKPLIKGIEEFCELYHKEFSEINLEYILYFKETEKRNEFCKLFERIFDVIIETRE